MELRLKCSRCGNDSIKKFKSVIAIKEFCEDYPYPETEEWHCDKCRIGRVTLNSSLRKFRDTICRAFDNGCEIHNLTATCEKENIDIKIND